MNIMEMLGLNSEQNGNNWEDILEQKLREADESEQKSFTGTF